jgi:hypothetical protein
MKHIEQILPEYAAGDLSRLLVSETDATASAALSVLLHNVTGCAIPPLADTPESEVEELVPLCLSILRRHWTTPLTALGDGTTPMSLADLMRRLILGRVDGNEALGIPPANANIPTAVAALTKRHIDDGLTLTLTDGGADGSTTSPTTMPLPDGLSLAQLLCSGLADNITELQDSNVGWTMTKALTFPNLERLELGCEIANDFIARRSNTLTEVHLPNLRIVDNSTGVVSNCPNVEVLDLPNLETLVCSQPAAYSWDDVILGKITGQREMIFPKLKSAYSTSNCYTIFNFTECEILRFPELEYIPYIGNANWISGMDNLKELHMPKFKKVQSKAGWPTLVGSTMANLHTIVLGKIEDNLRQQNSDVSMIVGGPNLIHIEVGEGVSVSFNLNQWQPSAETLSNPEFLSNFKTYIADRVADRTGTTALTLTLSAAVYEALQAQEGQTILATLTNKNWTVAQA